MNAINDLVRGALLGKVSSGTTERAILELAELYREIDNYDRICTEVRNELTAAGIPELTEDRLTVVPLSKRVAQLRTDFELALSILKRLAYKKSASDVDYFDLVAATHFVDDHTEPMR